ncbi:MAG: hypothetical protein ACE5ER_04805 [Nitrospinaceae bacterium]
MKTLDLNYNRIGNPGAFALAGSSRLAQLESLRLGQNRIGSDGARALTESPYLKNLEYPIFGFY